jgi:hypothetical protein
MNGNLSVQKYGLRTALAVVLAALLTACGGGGGGGGDSGSATTALATSLPSGQTTAQLPAVGQTQTAAPAQTATPVQGSATAPSTAEFRVNTTRIGNVASTAIARLKNGSHVIAWKSERVTPVGGVPVGVQGLCIQRYGTDAKALGGETCIAPNAAFFSPTLITALADGGYLLVWTENQDSSNRFSDSNIWAQRFDVNGAAVGSVQQINSVTSATSATLNGLSAAGLADGGYVVAWATSSVSSLPSDIYARRFNVDGAPCPCGPEKRVNTFTNPSNEGTRSGPSVVALKDGGYVVVWLSSGNQGFRGTAVYAQRYGADHNSGPIGLETLLTRNTTDKAPAVAALTSGGYVLANTYAAPSTPGQKVVQQPQVLVQPFAADGIPLAAQTPVNPPAPGEPMRLCNTGRIEPGTACSPFQDTPAVAGLDDGSFALTWTSDKSSIGSHESFVRRYSGEGAPLGAPAQFTATQSRSASLAPTSGGGFVVSFVELPPKEAAPSSLAPTSLPIGINARYFDAQAFRGSAAP